MPLVWAECDVIALHVILYGMVAARAGAWEQQSAHIETTQGVMTAASTKSE